MAASRARTVLLASVDRGTGFAAPPPPPRGHRQAPTHGVTRRPPPPPPSQPTDLCQGVGQVRSAAGEDAQSRPTERGADGPGTDPWCDPTSPPPPPPCQASPPRGTRAYTYRHGGISLSSAPCRGTGVVSSLDGCETRQPRGVPSRAGEVRAHWPWVTTFGASRDPTQPNQPPQRDVLGNNSNHPEPISGNGNASEPTGYHLQLLAR